MNRPTVNRPFHDPSGLLHHVELHVSDLPASAEFWNWLLTELGYARFQDWEQGVSWKRRDTYIALVQAAPEHSDSFGRRDSTGLSHLAFHARSRRQVDDLARELRRRGMTILDDDASSSSERPPTYSVYFEDPDRIQIALIAPD